MKVQILTDRQNPLLQRREIEVLAKDFGATPNRKELSKAIATELQVDESTLLLDRVNQEFGKKEAVCYVKVYQTTETKNKYEPAYKRRRMGEEIPKKEKKKQGKKAAKTE